MGCFLACFGASKDKRRRRHRKLQFQSGDERAPSVQPSQCIPVAVHLVPEISSKADEEKVGTVARKKVTFVANVETIEHVTLHDEVPDCAAEIEEDTGIIISPLQSQSSSEDVSVGSTGGSFTPNNRYANCRDSDDEDLGSECCENDLEEDYEEDGDDFNGLDEICNENDLSRVNQEIEDKSISPVQNTNRKDLSARDASALVLPVLKPIENLTQWKAAKAKAKPPAKHRKCKEDSSFDRDSRILLGTEPDPIEGSVNSKSGPVESKKSSSREVSVDASLSNWLVSPGSTPVDKKSPMSVCSSPMSRYQGSSSPYQSQEDRPILGALTVEEIRQFSVSNSPRKSPSRSPDEIPIIGTVGTYWNNSAGSANTNKAPHSDRSFKGIPNTNSKYREDKKVNWNATPFETRLERALDKSGSAAR